MEKKELDLGVQYLRGAAALFVVFFHLRHLISSVIPGINLGDLLFGEGSAGVDIFFVISGYIIALS
ncbi:TPA: acyltransferase, partial [Escherichia coli]|nr:acyltransferase [Escherichia coli]